MQHSLRERFRGAFLGAIIGERIGDNVPQHAPKADSLAQIYWGKLILQQTQVFVQPLTRGKASEPERKTQFDAAESGMHHSEILLVGSQGLADSEGQNPGAAVTPAGLAVAIIPIALFHHDHLRTLPDRIEQAIINRQYPVSVATGAIVIGYTLALILQEKLHACDLIPRLLTDLDLGDRDPFMTQRLMQVQSDLDQRRSLAMIKHRMLLSPDPAKDSTPAAIALYGFLSTPNSFRLSLLRSARLSSDSSLVCCLVGALSGAYNSQSGIPIDWRDGLNGPIGEPTNASRENIALESTLTEQADLLFATWSGVYQPSPNPTMVTALPDLIRPRPLFLG